MGRPGLQLFPRRAAGRLSFGALTLALVMAPLDFGSTRTLPYHILVLLVAFAGCLWALADGLREPSPGAPWLMVAGGGLVAASVLAWETWLPFPTPPDFTLRHFHQIAGRWPSSIVPSDKGWICAWCATAALALLALHRFCLDGERRLVLAIAITATGAVVAVLGLLQNATHARGIYWERSARMAGAFFGPFYHHTSAGAYLNSVWPLAAGLALRGLHGTGARDRRLGLLAGASAFVILVAHAGHISRFPQVIAAVAFTAGVLWVRPWRPAARAGGPSPGRLPLAAAGLAVAVLAVVLGGRTGDIRSRWGALRFSELAGAGSAASPVPPAQWDSAMRPDLFVPSSHADFLLGDRGAAYQTAMRAVSERPWFGWGPAGWMAAAAANTVDPFIRTFFQMMQFVHEDYLQAVVEWGAVGAAGWGILILGGVARSLAVLGSRPELDFVGAGAAMGLAAVLAQSLIDFPLQIPAIQMNAAALAAIAWSTRPPSAANGLTGK